MSITRHKGKRFNNYVADYVVFDLETTGIRVTEDAIIEISAVKVEKGRVTDEYSTLVNPHRPIPKQATQVNGITDDMVANAPKLETVLKDFLLFTDGHIMVGHNIHTFDTNFIYDAVLLQFGTQWKNDYVDTLYLSRKCLPQLRHHKLGDIASHFQISTQGAHRALNDCIMNQKCYEKLGELLAADSTLRKPDLLCPLCGGELSERSGRYGTFYGCSGFPGCRYTKKI